MGQEIKKRLKIILLLACAAALMASAVYCSPEDPSNIAVRENGTMAYPEFSGSTIELKDLNGGDLYPGEEILLEASIINSGQAEATGVSIRLLLSDDLEVSDMDLNRDIGSLGIGETHTFSAELKVAGGIETATEIMAGFEIISNEAKAEIFPEYNMTVLGVRHFERNQIPIIGLHAIEDEIEIPIELYTSHFEHLCSTLKTFGFETITFKDLLDYIDFGKALPEKPVIITSDDGFGDLYTNAFPILKEYGYTMTVFLVTGYVGDSEADRKVNSFDSNRGVPMRPMLIWPEITEMAEYGIEFLSHSANHIRLGTASEEVFMSELILSKNDIEAHLGSQVSFFAWPYDNNSPDKWPLITEAGYRGAVRYWGGIESLEDLDLNNIKRVEFNSYIRPRDYADYLMLHDIEIGFEYGGSVRDVGEEFTLKYFIHNNSSQDVTLSSIELELPDNLEFIRAGPGADIDVGPGLSEGIYMWVGTLYNIKGGDSIGLDIKLKALDTGTGTIKFRVTTNNVYIEGEDIMIEIK